MTKDKAITELVRIWHSPHLDLSLKAGLAEAIETLKESNLNDSLVRDDAEDCKESESKLDLIRRSDAMGAVQDHFNADGFKGYDDGQKMLDRLKALPSADITETETCQRCQDLTDAILNRQGDEIKRLKAEARPTGEWIDIDNYYSMATCSHCHKVTMFEKWGEYIRPYNFCPNCGARMLGEDGEA